MTDLQQIELIKRLKYKYFRTLDCHLWDELADCFAEDAVTNYDRGRWVFEGRENIINSLKELMDRPTQITQHQVHHPEIDLTSEITAKGIWYLQDVVIDLEVNTTLRGAALYNDEYVKVNGEWKIKSTGYVRTYAEIEQRSSKVEVTTNMFVKD